MKTIAKIKSTNEEQALNLITIWMEKIKQGPSSILGTHLPSEHIIIAQHSDHNSQ